MIGETIKDFEITSLLGRGGMGEVYLGVQAIVRTKVAIKLLREHISADRQHVQRFFNEAITASKIKHAGIVKIFDVGFHDERAFLIMEHLEGESLSARIGRSPPLAQEEIVDISTQLASILEATHAEGITHRDLKPDNIFLVEDAGIASKRRVKVLDFGIAKLSVTATDDTMPGDATAMTLTNSSMGTPAYMAPEQWNDAASADARADVYSLGCVIFEMCCGRPPFVAASMPEACAKHLHEPAPHVRSLAASIPAALDELVGEMLAKPRADRPAIGAVVERLAALAAGSEVPAAPATRREGLRPAYLLAGAGAVALAGAIVFFATRGDDPAPAPTPPPVVPVTTSPTVVAPPVASGCPDGMVRVPAGELFMGTDTGFDWEQPVHRVTLSSPYCIDRTEVTAGAYAACVADGTCAPAPTEVNSEIMEPDHRPLFSQFCNGGREDRADHPINCVSWEHARAYCAAVDKRLPTEAEWEFAARGGDGRRYPWGNESPGARLLNLCGIECRTLAKRALGWNWYVAYEEDDGWGSTAPAGSFPAGASPFGALDLAGNVAEWTADWYGPYEAGPVTDPTGPERGTKRAVRDTSWRDHKIDFARSTNRIQPPPERVDDQIGFRCARDIAP